MINAKILKSIFVVTGALLVMSAAKCQRTKVPPMVAAETVVIPDSADQVTNGGRVLLTDNGVTKAVLLADTVFTYEDGARLELRQVNLTFFTALGEKDGILTSREATYNARLSRLEARGNVVVLAEDGRRLDTQQLVYDQQRNQIFSDSAFVLNRPPQQISGVGFESDPQLALFRVIREFKAVAPVKIPVE